MIYELDPESWLIIGKLKDTTFEAIVFQLHGSNPFPIKYPSFADQISKLRKITDADIKYISEHIKYISGSNLEYSKRLLKEVMMEHYIHA